jgi:hypothetical protein
LTPSWNSRRLLSAITGSVRFESVVKVTFPPGVAMTDAPGVAPADRAQAFYALVADVWGEGRDEVILFNARGVCICANARPAAIPTLYNETLYPGM